MRGQPVQYQQPHYEYQGYDQQQEYYGYDDQGAYYEEEYEDQGNGNGGSVAAALPPYVPTQSRPTIRGQVGQMNRAYGSHQYQQTMGQYGSGTGRGQISTRGALRARAPRRPGMARGFRQPGPRPQYQNYQQQH